MKQLNDKNNDDDDNCENLLINQFKFDKENLNVKSKEQHQQQQEKEEKNAINKLNINSNRQFFTLKYVEA